MRWKSLKLNDKERRVFEALDDPKWDFRTINGIRHYSGLTEGQIREVLNKYEDYIYTSLIPDSQGRTLYTLRERKSSLWGFLDSVRTFVSKSID